LGHAGVNRRIKAFWRSRDLEQLFVQVREAVKRQCSCVPGEAYERAHAILLHVSDGGSSALQAFGREVESSRAVAAEYLTDEFRVDHYESPPLTAVERARSSEAAGKKVQKQLAEEAQQVMRAESAVAGRGRSHGSRAKTVPAPAETDYEQFEPDVYRRLVEAATGREATHREEIDWASVRTELPWRSLLSEEELAQIPSLRALRVLKYLKTPKGGEKMVEALLSSAAARDAGPQSESRIQEDGRSNLDLIRETLAALDDVTAANDPLLLVGSQGDQGESAVS